MANVRIGISGWTYPSWRGPFYPNGLRHRDELEFASRVFNSIEINGSFYSLQTPETYRSWYEKTPEDFIFAIKGSRFITHMKKLKDPEVPLANFFASGITELREKAGPILWQFPPQLKFDPTRFREFFETLPRTARQATLLARERDRKIIDEVRLRPGSRHAELRYAVEIRHDSFRSRAFTDLLYEFGIALVVSDSAGHWPGFDDVTADFVYARLHGEEELYAGGYRETSLKRWAHRVREWAASGKDVYVYFDNDAKVRAPFDALTLADSIARRQKARTKPRPSTSSPPQAVVAVRTGALAHPK